MPTPTVGRIVHFRLNEDQLAPATITRVDDANSTPPLVSLACFLPIDKTTYYVDAVPEDPTGESDNSWRWPPLV